MHYWKKLAGIRPDLSKAFFGYGEQPIINSAGIRKPLILQKRLYSWKRMKMR